MNEPSQARRADAAFDRVELVDTPRGPLEVAIAGDGPAVLAIHGTPGSWRQCFSLAEDLRDRYTVIAPSRPGFGRTPVRLGRFPQEQADAYAAALDVLGHRQVAVLGASGGGPSAMAFASRHADRTSALMLVCAMAPELIAIPPLLRLAAVPIFGEGFATVQRLIARRSLTSADAVAKTIAKSFTEDERARIALTEGMRGDLVAFATTHAEAPPGLDGIRADLVAVHGVRRIGARDLSIVAPTLVLHGNKDEIVPPSHATFHAKLVQGPAEVEIYQDCGHTFFITRRREVRERLRSFLAAHHG